MILVDHQIRDRVADHSLQITNFDDASVQPASYDLRIGPNIYAPPSPEQPYDLSKNGGAYRLPPYGTAVLETLENLHMPNNVIGRIGLKSGFARRGMIASVGPQIDPGFEGKLFISLFNVTAVSHVLQYKDTFLSIEFHTLDETPSATYAGPYQGKYSLGAEVLDAMVRLEGLTLSQMQLQFTELAEHVKAWSALAARFDEFLTEMKNNTEAVRQLAQSPPGGSTFVEARTLSPEEAVDEVLRLFRERKQLLYGDIIDALHIDLSTAIAAVEELEKRGIVESGR
jgi:dCTP deaminase